MSKSKGAKPDMLIALLSLGLLHRSAGQQQDPPEKVSPAVVMKMARSREIQRFTSKAEQGCPKAMSEELKRAFSLFADAKYQAHW